MRTSGSDRLLSRLRLRKTKRGKATNSRLPVNVADILTFSRVESCRIEFIKSWDESTSGFQVLKTMCAFANDYQHLNGGYIIIGVDTDSGAAVLPPHGIPDSSTDSITLWIEANCKRIHPPVAPIMSTEQVDGRSVLVIWMPGSFDRPHSAQDSANGERYYIRLGSSTVDSQTSGFFQNLMQISARRPFDDLVSCNATVDHILVNKVKEYVTELGSGLVDEKDAKQLYQKLRLTEEVNGSDKPRNIGLLMFSENPEEWFYGKHIEVVHFPDGPGGDDIISLNFTGGLHEQLRGALRYAMTFSRLHIQKQEHSITSLHWWDYPEIAVRESIANAIYHSSYDSSNIEPVKVYIYPERMTIASYPGPMPGLEMKHFLLEEPMPPVQARNRRIGEFLRALKLAETNMTGISKIYKAMRFNGSADPIFNFNPHFFQITLPMHPS
jgi:ATP-dependent DNA helicase RecG